MILDTMRPLFIFFLIVTVVFGASYWYVNTASICPIPIAYRLGGIDPRFDFSTAEAKAVLANAESLWEEATERELFVYDDEAKFTINFIYDERQQLASTEEEWRLRLDVKEAESRSLLEEIKREAKEYEALQSAYENDRIRYETRLKTYNNRVETLNKHGGASAKVFEELQAEQEMLGDLLSQLIAQGKTLNDKVFYINSQGERGNKLVEQYNEEVLRYNDIFGNRDLYTQGDFKRDRINIYKFSDTIELTKVIAHEFGHSLGVGHVEGEESLMYYLMAEQPDSLVLSQSDKEAFMDICGEASGFLYEVRRIIRTLLSSL